MKHIFTVVILLVANNLKAQFTVLKGMLSIEPDASVMVDYDIVNYGTIALEGKLIVSGNLHNEQMLLGKLGTLSLVGENQIVTSPRFDIASLYVRGGGTKTIVSDLTVTEDLSLESGIVIADQPLTILSSGTVRGGSAESYVEGFFYHQGLGQKFYPVGRDGTYAPVTLQNVSGSNPTVGLAYFSTPAFDGTEFHWRQQVREGTYNGSTAELTFTSENPDYTTYADELMVLGAEAGSEAYTVLGQSSLASPGNRLVITSDQPSTLPVLTVGFDIPENSQNLYLPNAFSLSAASPEDQRIKVYGQKVSPRNFYLAIQDTWGNIVYETSSWQEASTRGWEGLRNNATQVSPTYRYLLRGEFIGGKSFRQTGTIVQY